MLHSLSHTFIECRTAIATIKGPDWSFGQSALPITSRQRTDRLSHESCPLLSLYLSLTLPPLCVRSILWHFRDRRNCCKNLIVQLATVVSFNVRSITLTPWRVMCCTYTLDGATAVNILLASPNCNNHREQSHRRKCRDRSAALMLGANATYAGTTRLIRIWAMQLTGRDCIVPHHRHATLAS